MYINKLSLKGENQVGGWNNPNKIIIHHPEWYGDIVRLNIMMRTMGYAMVGYNYYVRKDGSIRYFPLNNMIKSAYGKSIVNTNISSSSSQQKLWKISINGEIVRNL